MESAASRSARVKLQLRDKKGRWIEMGAKIKWLNSFGKGVHGIAVDQQGENIVAEVDAPNGAKTDVLVNHHKVEVIEAKADLNGVTPANADDETVAKFNTSSGPTGYTVGTKTKAAITTPISELKVHDRVYPIGTPDKPYSLGTGQSSVVFKKFGGGLGTITAIKDGKYATIEYTDSNGETVKSFASLKHHAVKQSTSLDSELLAAATNEQELLKKTSGESVVPKWIADLGQSAEDDQKKATLPEPEAPAVDPSTTANLEISIANKDQGTVLVQSKDNSSIVTEMGDLKVGDKILPITSLNAKPYGDTTQPHQKHAYVSAKHAAGTGTVTSNNPGDDFVTVKGLDNKEYKPKKAWASLKTSPALDAEIEKAVADGKASLVPAAPETPEAPAAPEVNAPAVDPGSVENIKVSSNHKAYPGSVRVETKDGTPLLKSIATLKVGDKVYPMGVEVKKPYGVHGNYNPKSGFVHTDHAAGIGTVTSTNPGKGYVTVRGSDGKDYFPTKNFVAMKSTPALDAEIDKVKATFDAPAAEAPAVNAPAAPEVPKTAAEHPVGTKLEGKNGTFVEKTGPNEWKNQNSGTQFDPGAITDAEVDDTSGFHKIQQFTKPAAPEAAPAKAPIDISGWTKTGAQMGSNDGGVYTDETGKQWYVKKPASNEHAMNEVLADDLYKAAGIDTSNLQLADLGNGKLGTASPMLEGVQKNFKAKLSDKNYKAEVQDGFAMDVLLSNWDVAGLYFDNVVSNKEGKPVRVDPGGALIFRAQGAPKGSAFDKNASEWDTLRDNSKNSESAKVFGDMTDEQLVESAKRVESLTPDMIDAIVDATGFDPGTKLDLKDKLKARRENIIERAKAITPHEDKQHDTTPAEPAPAAPAEAPQAPAAPEPAPAPAEAPAAPAVPEAPAAPAPAPAAPSTPAAPADKVGPFSGIVLKDKGKTTLDSNGDTIKVGTLVTHKNGKNGKGIVIQVLPSTDSAKVIFENGAQQTALGNVLTTSTEHVDKTPLVPEHLSPGEVFFDTNTGKTHLGSKDGTPLAVGDTVSYTKKGVTQEGTIKGFYPGQQTVNIDFTDGTNSTKKASVLQKTDAPASNAPEAAPAVDTAPEAPADVTPEAPVAPAETPAAPEAPAAPEVSPVPEAPQAPEAAPTSEAPQTPEAPQDAAPEAAPAEAPAADDLSQFEGKLFDTMTPAQKESVPVGTLLHNTVHGHYWEKKDANTWIALGKDKKPLNGVDIDNSTLVQPSFAKLHEVNLPEASPETPAAPAADAPSVPDNTNGGLWTSDGPNALSLPVGTSLTNNPDDGWKITKVGPDQWKSNNSGSILSDGDVESYYQFEEESSPKTLNIPEAASGDNADPIDVPSLEGESLGFLTPAEIKALPVGTNLVGPAEINISKTAPNVWTQKGGEDNVIGRYGDDEILNSTGSTSAPDKYKILLPAGAAEFPEDTTDNAPDATPDSSAVDVSTMPVGTVVPARTGSSVGFKKTADNQWEMIVQDKGIGQHVDDNFVQNLHDTTKPEIKTPEAAATPAAPEAAPKTTGALFAEGDVWNWTMPSAEAMPVGTKMAAKDDNWSATKTGENEWTSSNGNTYKDKDMKESQDSENYVLTSGNAAPEAEAVPETVDIPDPGIAATPKLSVAVGDNWTTDGPHPSELPVGTKIKNPVSGWTITKTAEDEWYSANGSKMTDEKASGAQSAGDKVFAELPESTPKDSAAPEPSATPEAPVGKAGGVIWNSAGTDASELPVGAKLTNAATGWHLTKTGPDEWTVSDAEGAKYPDSTVQNTFKYEATKVLTLPGENADGTPDVPKNPVTQPWADMSTPAEQLPVGSKVSTGTWSANKTGPDKWESSAGSVFNDESINSISTNYDMTTPAGWTPEQATALDAPSTDLQDGDIWDGSQNAADLPVGSTISMNSSHLTKSDDATWIFDTGSEVDNSVVDQIKGSGWTYNGPLGGDTTDTPDASTVWDDVHPKNAIDMPNGTEVTNGTIVLKKTGLSIWKATSGNSVGTEYTDITVDGLKNYGWNIKEAGNTPTAPAAGALADGTKWEPSVTAKASELPVGSVLETAAAKLTKSADNTWDSVMKTTGATGTNDDQGVDGAKTGGHWTYHAPEGAATPAAAKPTQVMEEDDLDNLEKGTKIVNPETGYTLAKLPHQDSATAWTPIDANGQPIKFKDNDTWAAQYQIAKGSSYFPKGEWQVYAPGEDIPGHTPATPASEPAPSTTNKLINATQEDLESLPVGTVIKSEDGYTLEKSAATENNGKSKWVPQDENGKKKFFKDGTDYATSMELSHGSGHFPDGIWNTTVPGSAPSTGPAPDFEAKLGMSEHDLNNLPSNAVIVSDKGTTYKVSDNAYGNKEFFPYENGVPKMFYDDTSYAAAYELNKGSGNYPNGNWKVFPPGTDPAAAQAAASNAPAATTTPSAVSKLNAPSMSDLEDLPDGTILKDSASGYTLFKAPKVGSFATKWMPQDSNGNPMQFKDNTGFATSAEVLSAGYFPDQSFDVHPPGAVSAPSGPATGPVGSVNNPAVASGKKLTTGDLDNYPVGTTVKKEALGSNSNDYYYIKKADGNWDYIKKSGAVHSTLTSDQMTATYGHLGNQYTTSTVHQPKPYGKHAVLGSGEIVYAGQPVQYKSAANAAPQQGYIKSITNAGAISVQINGESKYKAASKLSSSNTYGLKQHIADALSGNNANSPSSATSTPTTPYVPPVATATPETFAGASADAYNAAGATVNGIPLAPTSGLTLAATGPVDKSNPLYGTDKKPLFPTAPALGKWDSAAWQKKVEDRYLANPNKAKDTVQQSTNWNTIQSVLDGNDGSLDKLLNSKYIDQTMFDEAKKAIADKKIADQPKIDAFAAEVTKHNADKTLWEAANPSSSQYVAASLPAVSTEAFTEGPADWSKAAVGTYSADAALAAIKKDAATASHGISVATDSTQIEDLDVRFQRNLSVTGEEVIDVNFKVTPFFAKDLLNTLKAKGATSGGQIFIPKFVKDSNTGLMKDTATSYSNSMAYASGERLVWTDPSTGAKVTFNHGSNSTSMNPHTLSNGVRIQLPKDATSADYQKVLENLGITAKPATAGDIKVFGENQFITTYTGGAMHDFKKNLSGVDRQKALDKIKAKYGISPDDLYFGVDSNGWSKFFLTDEAAKKLVQRTKVSSFRHSLQGSGSESEQMFGMITGANPGLSATYQRWTNGIHASGMSSSTDIGKGSGDFMFTRSVRSTSGQAGSSGIHQNPYAALKRIDLYGNPGDNFGQKSTGANTAIEIMTGNPASNHEIIFKHTIPLSEWGYVVLASNERTKLIDRLKQHGITQINGIPLENFILTSGMQVPTIDPSVYSASAASAAAPTAEGIMV